MSNSRTVGIRMTKDQHKVLSRKVKELAQALKAEDGKYKVTLSDVIKYCLHDSLRMFPAESINPKLLELKKGNY